MALRTFPLRMAAVVTVICGFLDAYTFVARGGVFVTAQTGNVVLLAVTLAEARWSQALAHLLAIGAFVAGVAVATHIRRGGLDRLVAHPVGWILGVQAASLLAIGFVPDTVPHPVVTIPITLLAAVQIELFRGADTLGYLPLANTGNLIRWVDAGYGSVADPSARQPAEGGRTVGVYTVIVLAFALGAVIGALATRAIGVPAAWIPAGLVVPVLVWSVSNGRRPA